MRKNHTNSFPTGNFFSKQASKLYQNQNVFAGSCINFTGSSNNILILVCEIFPIGITSYVFYILCGTFLFSFINEGCWLVGFRCKSNCPLVEPGTKGG